MSVQELQGKPASILESLFGALPSLWTHHEAGSRTYALLKQVARREVEGLFGHPHPIPREFRPFGDLVFPYHAMGAVDSLNLFDLSELILFSFYWVNRGRYKRALDIGANLGLHSILLTKCGYEVEAFEPDPYHFKILQENLTLNHCSRVRANNAAVSGRDGEHEFIRVLGNTTGSHLAGSKASPYGELQRFPVRVKAIDPLIRRADLMKIDAEGHEKEILLAVPRDAWAHVDALVEVESRSNAAAIYEHFTGLGIRLFSQKINWRPVGRMEDMPFNYREGTLFLTSHDEMPWS